METMWTRRTGRFGAGGEQKTHGDSSHNNNTTRATFGSGSRAEVCRADSKLAFNVRRAAACGLISAVSAEVAALNTTPSLLKLFPQGRFMAP